MAVEAKMDGGKQRINREGKPVWKLRQSIAGTRHETTFAGTKAEARSRDAQWRGELEREAGAPKASGKAVPTFSDFCPRYGEHAVTHLRPKTWEIRRYQLATLAEHFGAMKLTAINTEAVEAFKAARTRAGVKPRTINTEVAKLQAVLTYARDLGIPCASPKLRALPVIGRGRVTFWNAEQLAALMDAVERDEPEILPIVVFVANTGCRKGEALACEQAWVDLRRGMLTIQPNDEWQPKDNEPREIPISDALRPWLERALATPRRYVFVTAKKRDGGHSRWAVWPRRAFDRARRAAGLRGGPHTLRHSFAAAFLAGGGDMYLLSKILGHASLRTTERIYAHLRPEHVEAARNKVNVGPASGPARMEAKRRWAR